MTNHISFLLAILVAAATSLGVGAEQPRRIALLGDSMTWIGGDSCENPRGWSHWLRQQLDSTEIHTYARSGATWTNAPATRGSLTEYSEVLSDENVILSQVLRLEADTLPAPDLIFIYCGANDAWFASRRPGIFDARGGRTSLVGSIELSCRKLRHSFPQARIVLMTPVEMSKVSATRISQVADSIEAAASRLGLETLRADRHVEIRHCQEKRQTLYTTDGVHTNPDGARLIADFVVKSLF